MQEYRFCISLLTITLLLATSIVIIGCEEEHPTANSGEAALLAPGPPIKIALAKDAAGNVVTAMLVSPTAASASSSIVLADVVARVNGFLVIAACPREGTLEQCVESAVDAISYETGSTCRADPTYEYATYMIEIPPYSIDPYEVKLILDGGFVFTCIKAGKALKEAV